MIDVVQVSEAPHRIVVKRLLEVAARVDWFRSQHVCKLLRRHMDPVAVQRIVAKLGECLPRPCMCGLLWWPACACVCTVVGCSVTRGCA